MSIRNVPTSPPLALHFECLGPELPRSRLTFIEVDPTTEFMLVRLFFLLQIMLCVALADVGYQNLYSLIEAL